MLPALSGTVKAGDDYHGKVLPMTETPRTTITSIATTRIQLLVEETQGMSDVHV